MFVALNSNQRFHPVRIGARRFCCFLAYDPVNPNMFSVNDPSNIMSLLSRIWIQAPMFAWRARKNSTIKFQDCLGTWVRHCRAVVPSGIASHISSSESQSFRTLRRVLMLGKMCFGSIPSKGVVVHSDTVGSADVPSLPSACTTSSMESVAAALRRMQFDRSLGCQVWELGPIRR